MNLFLYFESFVILAFIFLCVSFLTRKEVRIWVVLLNLIFLGVAYWFIPSISGLPKPIGYGLPFFSHQHFTGENVSIVVDMYVPENNSAIYLLIKEKGEIRLYQFPYTDEFIKELNAAFQKNQSFGFVLGFGAGSFYLGDTGAHVPMDQFEMGERPVKPPPGPSATPQQIPIQ